jgi:hypothetical protein
MRGKRGLYSLLFCLLFNPLFAQVPVGAWRDHLPYSDCRKVVKIDKKIYVSTANNLFTYNTSDNSLEKLSKITGFSDIGVSTMEYNSDKKVLLIAYTNGNIDILKDNVVSNIIDLKKKIITGSKQANHIFFLGNYAYLSFAFGIVVVDLDRLEIKDTYLVGESGTTYEVFSVTSDNTYLYAATSKGIFKADITDAFLVDYSHWHRITDIPNSTGKFDKLAYFQGKVVANYYSETDNSDVLYYQGDNAWTAFLTTANTHKNELRVCNNSLVVSCLYHIYIANQSMELTNSYENFGFEYAKPHSSLLDDDGNLWVADQRSGLVSKSASSGQFSHIYPNGPATTDVRDMLWNNSTLYVTGGGMNTSWNNLYNRGELFRFIKEAWTSVTNQNAWDFTAIAPDPSDASKVYIGSWAKGLFSYSGSTLVANYNLVSSTPVLGTSATINDNYGRIGGLVADDSKNLWITNCSTNSSIIVKKSDGSWKTFQLGTYLSVSAIGGIHRDQKGQYWVILPRGNGIFVFNPNGTVDNESDDVYLKFKPSSILGEVISYIYCITSDQDGSVWVGTDHGIVVYSSPGTVLDGATAGVQPTIARNDGTSVVDALLGTETVNCIAVDGANRKWFGTEKGGAYLFSADGTKQISHYNTDNSPLFSNSVKSIAIDGSSGEVFFGTDLGIISYRSTATTATDDFTNVYVFPNPVREDFQGDVTITGLISSCSVKITDISGNLVYETTSLGGQAIWNCKTRNGRKVSTGVYLVFCTNDDGSKTYITKMLVIH